MSNSGDLMISLASGRRPPGIKSPLMFPQGRMYMDDFRRNEHNYELLRRNTIVISTINHSYWSYVHQLSYLGGPTLYSPLYLEPFHWFVILVACASYNYHLTIRQRLHGHCLRRYKKDQKNLQMIVNYTPNIPKHPQTSPNIPFLSEGTAGSIGKTTEQQPRHATSVAVQRPRSPVRAARCRSARFWSSLCQRDVEVSQVMWIMGINGDFTGNS